MDELSNGAKALLAGVFVVLLSFCGYLYIAPWNSQQMYVADKTWHRSIEECEDYTINECKPVEHCTPVSGKRVCTTSIQCSPKTHTRVINHWTTNGDAKIEPYWPVVPPISPLHYFKYYENYVVWFKRDTNTLPYRAWNYGDYNRLQMEHVYTVTTNILNIAIRAE